MTGRRAVLRDRTLGDMDVDVVLLGELPGNDFVTHQALAALLGKEFLNGIESALRRTLREIEHDSHIVVGAQPAHGAVLAQCDDRDTALVPGCNAAFLVDTGEQRVQFRLIADRQQHTAPDIRGLHRAIHRDEEEQVFFQVDTRFTGVLQQGQQVFLLFGSDAIGLVELGLEPDEERMLLDIAGIALLQKRSGVDRHRHKGIGRQEIAVIGTSAAGNNQHGHCSEAGQLQGSNVFFIFEIISVPLKLGRS